MIDLNDELLSSYLDDELDSPTREAVSAALSNDPGARVRLEKLRRMDSLLQAAVPAPPTRDDDALAARILHGHHEPATSWRWLRSAGLAAIAAGVGGFIIGALVQRTGDTTTSLELDGTLARALQDQVSGLASGEVRILLSTRLRDGRYCRQFVLSDRGEGVACRDQAAHWQLLAWDGSASAAPSEFQPAAASELIDAALDRLGAGEALDATAEREQIVRGWGDERNANTTGR